MREETKKQLQRIMDQAVKANQIAGMNMMVVKDGREELYLQCGYADKAKGEIIERDTLFRLFSMTKPITAAAAMLLFERGVIDLADPVSKYIPGFTDQKVYIGKITDRISEIQIKQTERTFVRFVSRVTG